MGQEISRPDEWAHLDLRDLVPLSPRFRRWERRQAAGPTFSNVWRFERNRRACDLRVRNVTVGAIRRHLDLLAEQRRAEQQRLLSLQQQIFLLHVGFLLPSLMKAVLARQIRLAAHSQHSAPGSPCAPAAQPATGTKRTTRSSKKSGGDVDYNPADDVDVDEPAGQPPTKKPRHGKTKMTLDDAQIGARAVRTVGAATVPIPALREPIIARSAATENLNFFYEILPRLSIAKNAKWEYTPATTRPRHVFNLPIHNNRDFRVVGTPKLELTEHHDPRNNRFVHHIGTQVNAWRIQIQDHSVADAPIIEPFRIDAYERRWKGAMGDMAYRDSITYKIGNGRENWFRIPESLRLSESAVSSAAEAIEIAEILCNILNRMPGPLSPFNEQIDSKHNAMHLTTCFAELTALFQWKADLDISQIDMDWYFLTGSPKYTITKSGLVLTGHFASRTTFTTDTRTISQNITCPVLSQAQQVKIAKLHTPAGFASLLGGPKPDSSTDQINSGLSLMLHLQWLLLGYVGTSDQLHHEAQRLRNGFIAHAKSIARKHGPLNGSLLLLPPTVTRSDMSFVTQCSQSLFSALLLDGEVINKRYSRRTQIPGRVVIRSNSRIMHSYIAERGLQALSRGDGPIAVYFEICEAADLVSLEFGPAATPQLVLDAYCNCTTEKQRQTVSHVCHGCDSTEICQGLTPIDDGRILCQSCISIGNTDDRSIGTVYVHRLVYGACYHDNGKKAPNKEFVARICDALMPFIDSSSSVGYNDAYASTLGTGDAGGGRPYQRSLDKPQPYWLESGTVYLHHPLNAVITTYCLNVMIGPILKCALPWLKKGLEAKESSTMVTAGYHPDHQSFWNSFEIFADNEWMIRRVWVPYSNKDRKAKVKISQAEFDGTFLPMAKSGKWTGVSPSKGYVGKAKACRRHAGPAGEMWSENDIEEIKDLIWRQIALSKRYNKQELILPQGSDGVPLLFSSRHKFNWTWESLFREMRARLWTLDELCDKLHTTQETPRSMLIEFVVQWFETGGKCWIFGFRLTALIAHLQTYSIARGFYRYDKDGNRVGFIQSGAQMFTGCLNGHLTSMEDYDQSHRTLVFESWKANCLRWAYFCDEALLGLLLAAIRGIYDQTAWYDAIDMDPKNFWDGSLVSDKSTLDDTDDEYGDDEELDHFASIAEANSNLAQSDDLRNDQGHLDAHQLFLLELHRQMNAMEEFRQMIRTASTDTLFPMMKKVLSMIEAKPEPAQLPNAKDQDEDEEDEEVAVAVADGPTQSVALQDVVSFAALELFTPVWRLHLDEEQTPAHPLEFQPADIMNWQDHPILSQFMRLSKYAGLQITPAHLEKLHNTTPLWLERAVDTEEEQNVFDILALVLRVVEAPPEVEGVVLADVVSKCMPLFTAAWIKYKPALPQVQWRASDLYDWKNNEHLRKFMEGDQNGDPPATCGLCHGPAVPDSMIRCNQPHCTKVLHYWCYDTNLPSIPQPTPEDALCRDHKPKDSPSRSQYSFIQNDNAATCYADSTMQIFFRLAGVKELLLDEKNFVCRPDAESGRTTYYPYEMPESIKDPSAKSVWRAAQPARHLRACKQMCLAMNNLCTQMFEGSASVVPKQAIRDFFITVSSVDPSYNNTEQNEARGFYELLIETVVKVTDDSKLSDRDALKLFNSKQEASEKTGWIDSLSTAAMDRSIAWAAIGRSSKLHGLFNIAMIGERECGEAKDTCTGISRSFEEESVINLGFHEEAKSSDTFALETLLSSKMYQLDEGGECPVDKGHARSRYRPLRIVYAPVFFTVAFNRQGYSGAEDLMCKVDLPEVLDLSPYADNVRLPSDMQRNETTTRLPFCIYRICAVLMFKSNHYVTYMVLDGEWILFDGLSQQGAVAKHPQAALNTGWVPSLVVYERQKSIDSTAPGYTPPPAGQVLAQGATIPAPKTRQLDSVVTPKTFPCSKSTAASCSKRHYSPQAAGTCGRLHTSFPETHACNVGTCDREFQSKLELLNHLQSHPTCVSCKKVFFAQSDLDEHIKGNPSHDTLEAREQRLKEGIAKLEEIRLAQEAGFKAKSDAQAQKDEELKKREEVVSNQWRSTLKEEQQRITDSIERLASLIEVLTTQASRFREEKAGLEARSREIREQLGEMELDG